MSNTQFLLLKFLREETFLSVIKTLNLILLILKWMTWAHRNDKISEDETPTLYKICDCYCVCKVVDCGKTMATSAHMIWRMRDCVMADCRACCLVLDAWCWAKMPFLRDSWFTFPFIRWRRSCLSVCLSACPFKRNAFRLSSSCWCRVNDSLQSSFRLKMELPLRSLFKISAFLHI